MTLRARAVSLVLAFGVLVLAAGAGIGYGVHQRHQAETALRSRLAPAAVASRTLLADIVDQETGERGYLITGDEGFLAPYQSGLRDTAQTAARLRRLLVGQPAALAQLARVEASISRWHDVGADPEIAARRSGNQQAAARAVGTGAGKAAFDTLRHDVERLQELVDGAQRRTTEQADDASSHLDWVLIAAGILAMVLLGVAGLLLRRWVLAPLTALRAQLDRVTGGDLGAAIEPTGPMEIQVVGAAAEAMRRRIVAELDSARSAREGLEQRGPVVSGLERQLRPPGQLVLPGLRAATAVHPAEGVLAGDAAHLVSLPDGRLAVVVLDVSGHGAGAGLVAVRLKHLLTAALRLGHGPAESLQAACDSFASDADNEERFATCLIADVDATAGRVRWANAGHPAALVVDVRGGRLCPQQRSELTATGPLLSSLGGSWTEHEIGIKPGQVLLAFSDGLIEARDDRGRELGFAGVGDAVDGLPAEPTQIVDSCLAAARLHAADWDRDDVTVVAVAVGPRVPRPARTAEDHRDRSDRTDRSDEPVA